MAQTQGQEPGDVLRAGLGAGIEERVAAASIGAEEVLDADTVAEPYLVSIAGTTTVGEVGALGKESAEDTVFHVKHGHVLVNHYFKPGRRSGAQQDLQLVCIQVIGSGDPLQAEAVNKIIRSQTIGDVEREIADAPPIGKELQVIVISHQIAVGLSGTDL